MTSYSYSPTIPNPPNDPADDVGQMQTNSASIRSYLLVDHTDFGFIGNGQHNKVTFNTNVAGSVTNAVGCLHTTASNLFYLKGATDIQLTGGATAVSNGSATLPSGIILKYGSVASSATGSGFLQVTITYTTPFPTVFLSVIPTILSTASAASAHITSIDVPTSGRTSFVINYQSAVPGTIYWVAIGN
jgi:hypothetical protein